MAGPDSVLTLALECLPTCIEAWESQLITTLILSKGLSPHQTSTADSADTDYMLHCLFCAALLASVLFLMP